MANNFLIALCGRSGAGKTAVTKRLSELFGWTSVESYTTRPMRKEGERGHIFISEEEFNKIPPEKMVAYTVFDGHRYCATTEQVEKTEMYIVDFSGIKTLRERYHGDKKIIVVFLDVATDTLIARMKQRGDSPEKIENRLKNDDRMFHEGEIDIDLLIDASKSIDEVAMEIVDYVNAKAA